MLISKTLYVYNTLLLCVNNVCSAGPTVVFIVCYSVLSSQQINGKTVILSLECIPHDLSHLASLDRIQTEDSTWQRWLPLMLQAATSGFTPHGCLHADSQSQRRAWGWSGGGLHRRSRAHHSSLWSGRPACGGAPPEAPRWPSSSGGVCASTSSKGHCRGHPGVAAWGVWWLATTDTAVGGIPLSTTAASRDGAGV